MSRTESSEIPQLDPARLRKARFATFFGFFQLGVVVFAWSTGTSPLRTHLGIDGAGGDAAFGLLALAIGIGAAVGCFGVGPVLDRLGPRRVVSVCLVLFPLSVIPLAYVTGFAAAFACGLLMGVTRGAVDTAANAHGVEVERHYGRPIMSAFHAAYPAGGFVSGLLGSALASRFTDSPAVSFTLIGVTMAVCGAVISRWLLTPAELLPRHATVTEIPSGSRPHGTATVTAVMVGFGVLLLAAMLAEGAPVDWGQEFVRRGLDTSTAAAAFAVTLYSGALFVGRVFGDRLALAFGPRRTVLACSLTALVGFVLISTADSLTPVYVGFVVLGLGMSIIAPLMLSSAGRIDSANAGRNLGIVNGIGYSGLLIGPAAITAVVDGAGLSWMAVVPFALIVVVAVAGPLLMRFAPVFRARPDAAAPTGPRHREPARHTD
ncbi:MFS transporter [Pseudonocardia alni]|uniref:MFS transporter n=1 Tax=Pseudonocardia alni TaxID=33907 RepID=UPI0033F10F38